MLPTVPEAYDAARDANALDGGVRLAEFEIRGVLGVGGFGIVYRAWDHALEREVALKEYMPGSLAMRGPDGRVTLRSSSHAETFALGLRSFVNEARMLARFDHPSLVKVYRFWEDHGTAYMVMPCYRGRTLREVRRTMPVPPDEAACRRLIDPLLDALELLHGQGVFHRDIAPDNILVCEDGTPVLLDFGAARLVLDGRTQALTAILKPNFAPLEQYSDATAMRQGPWTDLYGLGATVYFLLCGQAPMPAAARALRDEMQSLVQLAPPGCSMGFLQAIDWAMALRPPERPQTAAELRDVLDGRMQMPRLARRAATTPAVAARGGPLEGWTSQALAPTVSQQPATTAKLPRPESSAAPRPDAARAKRGPSWLLTGLASGAVVVGALFVWVVWKRPLAPVQPPVPLRASAPAPAPAPVPPPAPTSTSTPAREVPSDQTPSPAAQHPLPAVRVAAPQSEPRREAGRPDASRTGESGVPAGPRERCGDRMFFTMVICMKRECERPELAQHDECRRMRELEKSNRVRELH